MSHLKTTKESIKDILYGLECKSHSIYPAKASITEKSIDIAVNKLDLLITAILRNEKLKNSA